MAIQSRLATGYWLRKAILTVLFLAFGLWAAYDGWVLFPAQAQRWKEYYDVYRPLEARVRNGETLLGDESRTYNTLKAKYPQPPTERTDMDVMFQRWGIMPLCLGISVLFVATWGISARRVYTYNDDGSLVAPEGTFTADEMTGIDMTRWMSKSIAMLEINGGPKGGGQAVKLDAWIYAELEDVIDSLNRRFHPEEYRTEPSNAENDEDSPAGQASVNQVSGLLETDGPEADEDESDEGEFDQTQRSAGAGG